MLGSSDEKSIIMQRVTHQNPLPEFEKWIPDPELGEGSLGECTICYVPFNEIPDRAIRNVFQEIFGHRENNQVIHKVHRHCLEEWMLQNVTSVAENNLVICPGGCATMIWCNIKPQRIQSIHPEFQNAVKNHFITAATITALWFTMLMCMPLDQDEPLALRGVSLLFVGARSLLIVSEYWDTVLMPALFKNEDVPIENFSRRAIFHGAMDGCMIMTLMVISLVAQRIFYHSLFYVRNTINP